MESFVEISQLHLAFVIQRIDLERHVNSAWVLKVQTCASQLPILEARQSWP
jgi:hypothetical protein